jgi:hypothetical protein
MSFFNRGRNHRNNRWTGNWKGGHRRPLFSINFDVDPQELNQLFQDQFFNLVFHGILHPQPDRPPFQPQNFPSILIPPHVLLHPEVPAIYGWKEIVHHPISQHFGWTIVSFPLQPPINPNVQIAPVVFPLQSSHASKRLKLDILQRVQDKGKSTASPSIPSIDSSKSVSSCLYLKYDCSHAINEIQPQGSNQPRAT